MEYELTYALSLTLGPMTALHASLSTVKARVSNTNFKLLTWVNWMSSRHPTKIAVGRKLK